MLRPCVDRSEEEAQYKPNSPKQVKEDIKRVNGKASRKRGERACDCVLRVRYLVSSVSHSHIQTTRLKSLLMTSLRLSSLSLAAMVQQKPVFWTSHSNCDALQSTWGLYSIIHQALSRDVSGIPLITNNTH